MLKLVILITSQAAVKVDQQSRLCFRKFRLHIFQDSGQLHPLKKLVGNDGAIMKGEVERYDFVLLQKLQNLSSSWCQSWKTLLFDTDNKAKSARVLVFLAMPVSPEA
jgi:hypothetical protein